MPRLILLRHAKSDWDAGGLSDFNRPVSRHGQRALPLVATEISRFVGAGASVLCSSALRTQQTFELARPHWPECNVDFQDSLYESGVNTLCRAVRQVDQNIDCVVVIAHNPGLVMFLNWCLAEEELTPDCVHMPTSCAAVLELATVFAELQPGQAKLTAFIKADKLLAQQAEAV